MRRARIYVAVLLILTAVCGAGIVTLPFPFNFLVLMSWIAVAVYGLWRFKAHNGIGRAALVAVVHTGTMAAVITAAALAPVKYVDLILQKPVHLRDRRMTISQLSEDCFSNRESFPLKIYIPARGPAANSVIDFSDTRMSLRQFVAEVEEQTGCKHRFSGCGNSYSILYGRGYAFGLSFNPPAGSDYEW